MIAVSALTSYLYCPKKFYMQYALGLKEPAQKPTIEGTILHEAIDRMQEGINDVTTKVTESTTLSDLEMNYKKAYYLGLFNTINAKENSIKLLNLDKKDIFKTLWKKLSEDALNKAAFIFNTSQKNKLYGKELLDKIKANTEVRLESEILGLRGVADRVEEDGGRVLVYEMKTGKAPAEGIWPNHKIQLAAYMMMLAEQGREVEGAVEYSGERRKLCLNPFLEDEVKTLTRTVHEIIQTKKVPGCAKSENKCKICGLKKYCDYLH